ncbi:hypothetical protein ACTA71_000483 [Dictyostelium dimigraforme]
MKENTFLFFKIWRNIVLRETILNHLRLFKKNSYFKIDQLKGFNSKKNKYYVGKIDINFNFEISDDILSEYINCAYLKFSNKFNKSINNLKLTDNIKYLEFGINFNQPLKPLDQLLQLNNSLETLKFGTSFNQELLFNSNITTTTIESMEQNVIIENQIFNRLKTLIFGTHFNRPLLEIPNSITYLEFGKDFCQDFSFSKYGEPNLNCLKLKGAFNRGLKVGNLPSSLRILYLSDRFNMKLTKGMLPNGLEELYFQSNYNQELIPNESIPSTVKLIKLSFLFDKELEPGVFPPNVETIIFGESFKKHLKIGVIPDSVTTLKLPRIYKTLLTYLPQPPNINQLYSIPPNSFKNLSFY